MKDLSLSYNLRYKDFQFWESYQQSKPDKFAKIITQVSERHLRAPQFWPELVKAFEKKTVQIEQNPPQDLSITEESKKEAFKNEFITAREDVAKFLKLIKDNREKIYKNPLLFRLISIDKELALELVKIEGNYLVCLPSIHQIDLDIIQEALKNNPRLWAYFDFSLLAQSDFAELIKTNKNLCSRLPESLKEDRQFVLNAICPDILSQTDDEDFLNALHEMIMTLDLEKIYQIIKENPALLDLSSDCFQRLKDVEERNLLHLAAYKNDLAFAEILHKKGYSLVEKDRRSSAPLDAAFAKGHLTFVQRFLEQLEVTEDQFLKWKLIGHIFRKEGIFHSVNLESYNGQYACKDLSTYALSFLGQLTPSKGFNTEDIQALKHIALQLPDMNHLDASELIENMKKGIPVLIFTGWQEHIITVTFWYDPKTDSFYFSKNNRGSEHKVSGLEIFKIGNPEYLNKAIDELRNTAIQERNYSYFLKELEQDLEATCIDSFVLKKQSVGNCGWSSAKAGFFSLLWVYQKQKHAKSSLQEQEKGKKAAWTLYKEWSTFVKEKAYNSLDTNDPIEKELRDLIDPKL